MCCAFSKIKTECNFYSSVECGLNEKSVCSQSKGQQSGNDGNHTGMKAKGCTAHSRQTKA